MTIGLTNAYTAIITISTLALNLRKVDESPAEYYTCPTDKKAIIKGTAICTSLGASTEARLQANAVTIVLWNSTSLSNNNGIFKTFNFECQLNAGESLAKSQNSGVNAEINVNAMIQEVGV